MGTIESKIARVLSFQTEPVSAKRISRLTHENHSSVRVTLRRMKEGGAVQQTAAGLYVAPSVAIAPSGLIRERMTMHGIKLEARCNNAKGSLSFEAARDVTTGGHRHGRNHSITYSEEWLGRRITVTHHEAAGKVEVWLKSNDDCLEFQEFLAFCGWVQGRFPGLLLKEWECTMIGFNWDTSRVRLQGVQKMSLQMWQDVWLNVYRRESGTVRIETHSTKKLNLAELLETISMFVQIVDSPLIAK